MSYTLEKGASRKNNNFDLIRLIASVAVIYGHSFYLFPTGGYNDIFKKYFNTESGSLAVDVFFFLSGIFITASFINSTSIKRFVLMRIFRIWPALIVCVAITSFLIGQFFTTLPLKNYLFDYQTYKYFFKNISLITIEGKLPGVFETNFFSESVNGSLWTLPNEIKCYLIVFLTGLLGLLKRPSVVVSMFVASLVMFRFFDSDIVKQFAFFLAGSTAYSFKKFVIIDYKIALLLLVTMVGTYYTFANLFTVVFHVCFIYMVLLFGTSKFARKIKLPGDYSYGIYIYGFLTQQIIAHIRPGINSYPSMLISIPIVFIVGVLSWHFIELPAIKAAKTYAHKC